MRKRYLFILVALLTLAFGRVIHEPFFTAAPAAEKTALSHSQSDAIQKIVFPTTQDDGEGLTWLASAPQTTIDAAPVSVPTISTTQPSADPVAMFWKIETSGPTYVVAQNQSGAIHRNPLSDPIALVENSPANRNVSDDFETLSSGEGSSGKSSGGQSTTITLPPVPAGTAVISSPPAALNIGNNSSLDPNSNNSGNTVIATPTPAPEPCSFLLLAAIVFTTETARARRNKN